MEKKIWQDFVLISWHQSRPGLHFGVYPLYNNFDRSQFKRCILPDADVNVYTNLHLLDNKNVQNLSIECPPIGTDTYFQPSNSNEIWRCTLVWRGTKDDCLKNLVKYEKWVFSHLLQAGNCKRCQWKMTEEEFDLSNLLGRYGTMANLLNEDFSQSIEEMENRPKSKKIKLDSIETYLELESK